MAAFAGAAGRAGLRAAAEPDVRGPRRLRAGGRGHRRRHQGDVRLRGQGRTPHRPAARGHRAGGPGLRPAPADHPWKVWYAAPTFRYERPQAGRYRQHHQLGVEALGSADADLDVEVIALAWDFCRTLGLRQVELLVNSMGEPADRAAYTEAAPVLLPRPPRRPGRGGPREGRRPPAAGPRLQAPADRGGGRRRPRASSTTCRRGRRPTSTGCRPGSRPWRSRSRSSPRWCVASTTTPAPPSSCRPRPSSAAQNAIGGGGRYDGLAEALGGPPTPGIGFGSGIERILLACDAEAVWPVPDAARRRVRGRRHRRRRRPRPHRRAASGRPGRRPRLRRPVDEGPDEGGRPSAAPASPSSWARTRPPPARSPLRDLRARTASSEQVRRPTDLIDDRFDEAARERD